MRRHGLVIASLALALGGCGSDDAADTKTAPAAAGNPAPANLVGTYAMRLKPADLPSNPPRELTEGSNRWKLKIANTGGPDGAPSFTISNAQLGVLESSRLSTSGDRVLLHDEECAAGPPLVESAYRWSLSGKTLTLTTIKNGCKDGIAKTLLTAEPWTRGR